MTASTMFMDVVTELRRRLVAGRAPTASSAARSGCARPSSSRSTSRRSRRRSSAASDHVSFAAPEVRAPVPAGRRTRPVSSIGIGTLEIHSDRPDQRLRRDRQRRRAHAADDDPRDQGQRRQGRLAGAARRRPGARSISPQARLHHAATSSRQHRPAPSTRTGRAGQVLEGGKRRPAAYKTGTTNDENDLAAYGLRRRPEGQERAGPRRRRLDGQLATTAPAQRHDVARLDGRRSGRRSSGGSAATPIAEFKQARRASSKVDGRRQQRDAARAVHPADGQASTSSTARRPRRRDNTEVGVEIDKATGKLWQDGCLGPKVTKGFMDLSNVETGFPKWQKYTRLGGAGRPRGRASAAGRRAPRRPTSGSAASSRSAPTWGAPFAPIEEVPDRRPGADARARARARSRPARLPAAPSRPGSRATAARPSTPLTVVGPTGGPPSAVTDGRSSPRRRPRRARPDAGRGRAGGRAGRDRTASRSAPVPRPWTT